MYITLKEVKSLLSYNFEISSYQRGYRWGEKQVNDLLEDLWEFSNTRQDENYCLQPLVVKKLANDKYEVIDGQQRLTTIFLIISYISKCILKSENEKIFSISYKTRSSSEDFLLKIETYSKEDEVVKKNIDFSYMQSAFDTIRSWFGNKDKGLETLTAMTLYPALLSHVQFIWYEVDEMADSIDIFTRLNSGKIQLTNAELIKALLLSSKLDEKEDSEKKKLRQSEMAAHWDRMEQKLNDANFWGFITNENPQNYPTRLELIFDLISEKYKEKEPDSLHTFLYFNTLDKDQIWEQVDAWFKIIDEWYSRSDLYHLIGYYIYYKRNNFSLKTLLEKYRKSTKKEFKICLKDKLRTELNFKEMRGLTYEKDRVAILNLLVLFNIALLYNSKENNDRFPFHLLKDEKWSLEHIHAQNSESLTTQEEWKKWLRSHAEILKNILTPNTHVNLTLVQTAIEDVLDDIEKNVDTIGQDKFSKISKDVFRIFQVLDGEKDQVHGIDNLALLQCNKNSALNNSVFAVKRNKIVEMDKKGEYIPLGTRNVFLKYYTPSQDVHFNSWNRNDREQYCKAITNELNELFTTEQN